jgi:hypothetical protein
MAHTWLAHDEGRPRRSGFKLLPPVSNIDSQVVRLFWGWQKNLEADSASDAAFQATSYSPGLDGSTSAFVGVTT